jgi:hypothetical protein
VELSAEQAARLQRDAGKFASRALRGAIEVMGAVTRVVFVCPRNTKS